MLVLLTIFILLNILFISNFNKFSFLFPLDRPILKRKCHKNPTPKIGNFMFLVNILLMFVYIYISCNELLFDYKIDNIIQFIHLFSFFILLGIFGFFEDKINFTAYKKTLILVIIFFYLLFFDFNFIINALKFNETIISLNQSNSFIVSILILLLIVNIFNLFDGINGQIGFYFIFLTIIIVSKNLFLPIMILPTLITFIYLNLKNKAFMGDGGIFILSTFLYINFVTLYNDTRIEMYEIILIIFLPLIDTIRVFFRRLVNKKSPVIGDRDHIHHLLIKNFSLFKTLIITFSTIIFPYIFYLINNKKNFYFIIIFKLIIYSYIILRTNNFSVLPRKK